jgi:hypothetical protein
MVKDEPGFNVRCEECHGLGFHYFTCKTQAENDTVVIKGGIQKMPTMKYPYAIDGMPVPKKHDVTILISTDMKTLEIIKDNVSVLKIEDCSHIGIGAPADFWDEYCPMIGHHRG